MYGSVGEGDYRSRIARLGPTIEGSVQPRRLERESQCGPSVASTGRTEAEGHMGSEARTHSAGGCRKTDSETRSSFGDLPSRGGHRSWTTPFVGVPCDDTVQAGSRPVVDIGAVGQRFTRQRNPRDAPRFRSEGDRRLASFRLLGDTDSSQLPPRGCDGRYRQAALESAPGTDRRVRATVLSGGVGVPEGNTRPERADRSSPINHYPR